MRVRHTDSNHMITKISWIYRLPFFLIHGAPLHALRTHKSSTILIIRGKKLPLMLVIGEVQNLVSRWGNSLINRLW